MWEETPAETQLRDVLSRPRELLGGDSSVGLLRSLAAHNESFNNKMSA